MNDTGKNDSTGRTEPEGAPIRYMERTRRYYRALGYKRDYVWAHHDAVPFRRLAKPLSESRIALVTTSSPPGDWDDENRPPKTVWSGETSNPPAAPYTMNVAWDKESTHTDDRESFLPIDAIAAHAAAGRFARPAPRFHGIPTDYSHRKTNEEDAPEILRRVREDGADAAFLVPL